eukprot:TRINITY_DN5354_c0_g1_i8.p2 TRINITY_DN5354_c0_g1~~TRINITY_DN5354_c0_g1_i8.p2  ORF type:complete len:105 (+),score=5.53 TRINITY_DN5354_c0_g1_i8:70-384(+)
MCIRDRVNLINHRCEALAYKYNCTVAINKHTSNSLTRMNSKEVSVNLHLAAKADSETHVESAADSHKRERSQSFIPYEDVVKRQVLKGMAIRYLIISNLVPPNK